MLRLTTLGGLSLAGDDGPVTGAATQRRRLLLLALLAGAGPAGMSRDRVLAYLWPESDAERARNSLSQAVFGVRRGLAADVVLNIGGCLLLNSAEIASDVTEFRAALEASEMERAASLYAGPFLDGIHFGEGAELERWISERRAELGRQYASVLARLATDAELRDDAQSAARWWHALALVEPTSPRVALGLMTALASSGDRAGALQYFRLHELLLREEFGVAPEQTVTALVERLRAPSGEPASRGSDAHAVQVREDVSAGGIVVQAAPREALPREHAPSPVEIEPAMTPRRAAPRLGWAAAAVAATAVALAGALWMGRARVYEVGDALPVAGEAQMEIDAAIAPDGRFMAYAAGPVGNMRVYVRQIGAERPVMLTPEPAVDQRWPRWSPDGSRILFGAAGALYVVPALGGSPTRVMESNGRSVITPSWSPDGSRIAYADERGIWIFSLATGRAEPLVRGLILHSPAWSPDGRRLAYVRGNRNYVSSANLANLATSSVRVVAVDGGTPVPISDSVHMATSPIWTPDGRSLLYVSDAAGPRDLYQQSVSRDGRPRGPAHRLTAGLGPYTISLTADGNRLGYSVLLLESNIWRAPISPAAATPASEAVAITSGTQNIESFGLSPDRAWLAMSSNRHGPWAQLFRMASTGGEPTPLTNGPEDDFAPEWSPDGREIAFHRLVAHNRDVYVITAAGADLRRVTSLPSDELHPVWSRDGRHLAFMSNATGSWEICVVDRTGGGGWSAPRRLTSEDAVSQYVAWSTDGRELFYVQSGTLRAIAPAGGNSRLVLDPRAAGLQVTYPASGRDQSLVYFQAIDSVGVRSFWEVSRAGGNPRLLLRWDRSDLQIRRPSFAVDGANLYFSVANDEADVWMLSLRH